MYTTVIDTETTGLLEAEGVDISLQPHITEIYAKQVDDSGKIIKELDTLIKPPIPIPDHITKITGINDYTLRNAPTFIEVFKELIEVFFCSHTMVAHNLPSDEGVIINELRRIGKEHHFPYCPIKYCTVEQSLWIKGHRLKNAELHKIATGNDIVGAHRAKADVEATYENYLWLLEQKNA